MLRHVLVVLVLLMGVGGIFLAFWLGCLYPSPANTSRSLILLGMGAFLTLCALLALRGDE